MTGWEHEKIEYAHSEVSKYHTFDGLLDTGRGVKRHRCFKLTVNGDRFQDSRTSLTDFGTLRTSTALDANVAIEILVVYRQ